MSDFNNLKCVILVPEYVLLTLGAFRKKTYAHFLLSKILTS